MAIHRRPRQAAKEGVFSHRRRRPRQAPPTAAVRERARNPEAERIDEQLAAVAEQVLAGHRVEFAWVSFRLQYFPGWGDDEAAAALSAWSTRQHIQVMLEERTERNNAPLMFVRFRC